MVINGMDLRFLDNIDIEQDSVIKPIRFNENELYMLKFQDMQNYCNKEINNIKREDIENIVSDILKEKDFEVNNINDDNNNDKYVNELELLGLKKR